VSVPASDSIRIVPLGGLGEIGMNCFAVEHAEGIVVVDCGVEFPFDDIGVDVLHPSFEWLLERRERVRGLFITHGHEDHIGAVPHLLNDFEIPVYGPPHALALVRKRLDEAGFARTETPLTPATPGQRYELGPFRIEPIRVSHSIMQATALAIETPAGTLVHTGDFNMDPDPPDGEPIDEKRFRELGDAGVRLLLSDSTNIDVPERPGSERSVGAALDELIGSIDGRIVVALFSSNVQRLILLGEIAQRRGRKLCLLGRSLGNHVEVARQLGVLDWPSDLVVSAEGARSLPHARVLVLAGGTQAERGSALRRMASGTHPDLKLSELDHVIFSSRTIPGNERTVMAMMSDLMRLGVKVHTRMTLPAIHTSGHAGRSEQRRMLEWTRPQSFVPVHGTLHHLNRHAELARSVGVTDVLVTENGIPVVCTPSELRLDSRVATGKVRVALGGEALSDASARERQELARSGVVVVSLSVDDKGRPLGPPGLSARGVPFPDGDEKALAQITGEIGRTLDRLHRRKDVDLERELVRAVRRELLRISGERPEIVAHVLREATR
jgi:ribonuclease J